jgi:hypothetical protein
LIENKSGPPEKEGRLAGLHWRITALCPSSKTKSPDLLGESELRTTGTRERLSSKHIGGNFTSPGEYVNTQMGGLWIPLSEPSFRPFKFSLSEPFLYEKER